MIDITKSYQTRDGRKVRILCTNGPDETYPVVGFIADRTDPVSWSLCGSYAEGNDRNSGADLVEIPASISVEFWINLYRGGGHTFHTQKRVAEHDAHAHIFARIHIKRDVIKGEGL